MGTLLGAVFGYVFRGMSGSEGFHEMVESARAVKNSREFESLVQSAKLHASHMVKDVSARLSEHGGQIAEALSQGVTPGVRAEAADWEAWPPKLRPTRPFSDDANWPRS